MTTVHFRIPEPEIRLQGHVTYRCSSCGELINGPATFYDPERDITILPGGALTPTTRTYHPAHVPKED